MNFFKRLTAIFVCFMISPLAGMCAPQGGTQRAGEISALIPAATRNAQPTKAKDEIDWNDLLKTEHSGRVRAGLTDGSILSVGSDSELRVVQHDGATQQTSLELSYGKVRNQVTNITKAGGKYELKTPNAVIGVIGTDFVAEFKSNKTTVICYKGKVKVTPLGKIVKSSGQQGTRQFRHADGRANGGDHVHNSRRRFSAFEHAAGRWRRTACFPPTFPTAATSRLRAKAAMVAPAIRFARSSLAEESPSASA